MHERNDIIKNQKIYREDILKYVKEEFKSAKSMLYGIDSEDEYIKESRKNLILKLKKAKFDKNIEALFINEKNIYPKVYAWWDNNNKEVQIFKYKEIVKPIEIEAEIKIEIETEVKTESKTKRKKRTKRIYV
jgi:hypothetical protein